MDHSNAPVFGPHSLLSLAPDDELRDDNAANDMVSTSKNRKLFAC